MLQSTWLSCSHVIQKLCVVAYLIETTFINGGLQTRARCYARIHESWVCFFCDHEWKSKKYAKRKATGFCTLPFQTPLIQHRDPCMSTSETVKRPLIRRGLMNYWSPLSMPICPHPSPTHYALRIYIPFKSESFEFRLGFWAWSLKRATQRWMFLRWRPINLRDSLLSAALDLLNSLCHAWVNGKSFPKHFPTMKGNSMQ